MFEVLKITDIRGKNLDDILLIDKRRAQGRDDGGGSVWFVFPFGDNVIDLLGFEGGECGRKRGDEARCTERVFLYTGTEEDGIREHRSEGFRVSSGVLQGDDEDPLFGGEREGA